MHMIRRNTLSFKSKVHVIIFNEWNKSPVGFHLFNYVNKNASLRKYPESIDYVPHCYFITASW